MARRRRRSPVKRGLAAVLATVVVGAGALYMWQHGHWGRLPGLLGAEAVKLHANRNFGVVDVGRLYDDALRLLARADAGTGPGAFVLPDREERHTREILNQAGQLLTVQGEAYLDQVRSTLAGDGLTGDPAAEMLSAATLREKGVVLGREMRRLGLARVAVTEEVWWQDLARLQRDELISRYDSLLSIRSRRDELVPDAARLDAVLRSVENARLKVAALARVRELLDAPRWSETWLRELESATARLSVADGDGARAWRRVARSMMDLKRAEQVAAFADRALDDVPPVPVSWPASVRQAVPDLEHAAGRLVPAARPELVRATVNFYAGLERGWKQRDTAAPEDLADLVHDLRTGGAVRFDPAAYGDHVERLALAMLEALLARGLAPEAIPFGLVAESRREEAVAIVAARRSQTTASSWRSLADRCQDPFLRRYADRRARDARFRLETDVAVFAAGCGAIRAEAAAVLNLARSGVAVGSQLLEISQRARDLLGDGPSARHASAGSCREVLERLAAVADGTLPVPLEAVTVRLAPGALATATEVVVELGLPGETPRRSAAFLLGPAAPAGTGWVGTAAVAWPVTPRPGQQIAVRVVEAADGNELLAHTYGPWLEACEPATLTRPAATAGSRISWRLGEAFWDRVLPGRAD